MYYAFFPLPFSLVLDGNNTQFPAVTLMDFHALEPFPHFQIDGKHLKPNQTDMKRKTHFFLILAAQKKLHAVFSPKHQTF